MSQTSTPIPSPITHFSDYETVLRTSIDSVVATSSSLPDDLSFHRSLDRQFAKHLDSNSERILSLTSRLLDFIDVANNVNANTKANAHNKNERTKGKRRLDCEEDVLDNFHSIVVDVLDQMLERADMALDELSGKNKPPAIPINMKPQNHIKPNRTSGTRLDSNLINASHISKPQLLFHEQIDNRNTSVPWKPQLKSKPNAVIPLEEFTNADPSSSSQHPYTHEILNFQPPAHLIGPSSVPLRPEPLESSPPLLYISQKHQLPQLLHALSQVSEIAIDLEHHSYRSFSGFVCLMQISTRTQDWIIDCLNPDVRENLECLNEVFTNPNIVKVFHGAGHDILWLQQNFNLYVVNMFDTFNATKVLDFPKHSLAALLEMYCDFTADKRYQLADWRIRPLPNEMLDYARSDTHFLLYIYDNLRNALLNPRSPPPNQPPFEAGSPLLEVIKRSSETALKVYVREVYDAEGGTGPGGWELLCRKWNKSVGSEEDVHGEVFKAVHAWRDRIARREDESTRYVLPNHSVFRLAEKPPSDPPGLLSICHPVTPLVRAKSLELLEVIKKAVDRSLSRQNVSKIESVVAAHDGDKSGSDPVRMIGSAKDASGTGIWDKLTMISNIAPSSTPFGSLTVPVSPCSTTTSAFWGSLVTPGLSKDNEKYINAVRRINSTLTLNAPLPPKSTIAEATSTAMSTTTSVVVAPATSSTTPGAEETATPNPAAVVEIPFIPPSQRPTIIQDPITNDNIVVVGRQRKRKRKDKMNKDPSGADDVVDKQGSSVHTSDKAKNQDPQQSQVEMKEVTPYDFSKEKNILDESAAQGGSAPALGKKRKDKKGNHHDNLTFGPAPRNRSEMKSGNMSGRFK